VYAGSAAEKTVAEGDDGACCGSGPSAVTVRLSASGTGAAESAVGDGFERRAFFLADPPDALSRLPAVLVEVAADGVGRRGLRRCGPAAEPLPPRAASLAAAAAWSGLSSMVECALARWTADRQYSLPPEV